MGFYTSTTASGGIMFLICQFGILVSIISREQVVDLYEFIYFIMEFHSVVISQSIPMGWGQIIII